MTAVFNLIAVAEIGSCDFVSVVPVAFFKEHPEKAAEDSNRDVTSMEKVQCFIIFLMDI